MRLLYLTLILAVANPAAVGAPVTLQNATATFTQSGFLVSQSIDGNLGGSSVVNGWAIADAFGGAGSQTAVYETLADVGGPGGAAFTFTLTQNFGSSITLGKFRLSVTTDVRTSFADGLNSGGDVTATWFELGPVTALATNGTTLTIQGDKSILASGTDPTASVYTVTASTLVTNITGFRLEALEDDSLPSTGPGRAANGNFVLQELVVDAVALLVPEPPGDHNGNGIVDTADYVLWRRNNGTQAQYDTWRASFGDSFGSGSSGIATVPEPATVVMLLTGSLAMLYRRCEVVW